MKISKFINQLEEWLITFLLASMTLLTFSQVVARYVFNSGVVWALEVTTYLFAWLVLLGASYIIKCGAHIAVDSVVNLFSEKNRKIITLFAITACMAFVVIMFMGSYEYISLLKEIEIEMEDLPVLEWQAKIILPLGFALMFYRLIEVMIDVINNKTATMHFENHLNDYKE
ncbi:TRAP-type C4-dicarboxylate transport system, small permease component [uncultured Gammaproteobacteria bacterium]|uniref:TRAP transporter small permease n=1 Tax=Bathymodiolus heckerae thiotrophic gill symbiont TaxID=1052212 RepID=UPI0010AF7556|nr:TRAP transporter small permease [Bathymodiolus heckerae thiotrophic gill symbiont]CAC9537122.1 TRAP-type C4-dicarboxylate transport system, small permease component [uncultured Gammaproteobacteria bacterium]CAC9582099.1 TRAP-type C4-dicarboxylate transport system, small permease component [uncultured Gammaproteobacteria bacterium]CAC9582970.1 TRAP-type C4-dicarboxylate transport system, small permease component [uncultured Gammaproteobacteria bacterium]CAC9950242.1 TRAP-type C4-dicarboxylate